MKWQWRKENKMKKGKQRIIDTAFKLILQKGIKETSVRDIAKAAGISVGTFTYHYPSKEELLFDIFEMTMAKQDEVLIKGLQSERKEEKKKVLEEILSEATSNEYFMKLNYYLLGEAFAQNKAMLEKMKEKYQLWRDEFKVYIRGEIVASGKEGEINASLLLAMIDGLAIQLLLDKESVDIPEMAQKIVKIIYE